MFGDLAQFERLDVRERLCFSKTRNCFQCGPCAGADDHISTAELTSAPVEEGGLHSSRSNEPPGAQNELGARRSVILQIHVVQADDHLALAVSDARHLNREAIVSNAKLFASAKVVHNFRTMDNVLARKARNIRARAANILAIDDCDLLSFASKRPRGDGRTRATTENHQIKFFRLRLLKEHGRMEGSRCSSCDFSFLEVGSFSCTTPALGDILAALSVICTVRNWMPLLVRVELWQPIIACADPHFKSMSSKLLPIPEIPAGLREAAA